MIKSNPCKQCGSKWHTAMYHNRKPIKRIGKVTENWLKYRQAWIKRNMTPTGTWVCALQISGNCPKILTVKTLTLDHIIPRSARPDLRFADDNIQPACWSCNNKKGSKH